MATVVNTRDVLLQATSPRLNAPGVVTGLAAVSIIGGIRITGTLPDDDQLEAVILYENTVNNSGTATQIAEGLADHYDRLNLLPSAGTRYYWAKCRNKGNSTLGAFSNVASATAGTADWSTQVTGTGKPANNADNTSTILSNAATTITMASSTLLKYTSGLAGVFLGSGGFFGKDASGNATFSIVGSTGAATFAGDITTAGVGRFNGATSDGSRNFAIIGNDSGGQYGGLKGLASTGRALWGEASSSGDGAFTSSVSGNGLYAQASTGIAVKAQVTSSGTALQALGPITLNNSTFTWNALAGAAPAGSTTTCLHNDMVWRDPVTTARVNAAYGVASSGVCHIVVTDSGTATVSGGGLNMNSGLTGYQFTGSGNFIGLSAVSDARLKTDIRDEELGHDFIMALRPRRFRMRSDQRVVYHGFIFQEVAKVVPQRNDALARWLDSGIGSTDTIAVIAPLVNAYQQQARRIDALLREVEKLKARNPWHWLKRLCCAASA